MPDYYNILGVRREASLDEIKRAYRLKAKMFHPDVNKSADAVRRFEEINEAYQALMNGNHGEHDDAKQPFDAAQYRKYGKNYNMRYTEYTGPYSPNPTYAKEQAEAKERELRIKKFNEKHAVLQSFCFFLAIGVIMTIVLILAQKESKTEDDKYYYKVPVDYTLLYFLGFIWIVVVGGIIYSLYQIKKEVKQRTQYNSNKI